MAIFKRKQAVEATFDIERTAQHGSNRVVAVTADSIAEPFPSPALALQQLVAERAADGFIADPAARRRALIRFLGTAVLLWGGAAGGLALLIAFAG